MIRHLKSVLAALLVVASAAPALAHPHVWVMMQSELIYSPEGAVTGIRHAWTFDDMFSSYATQGLPQATKGRFTREELAPLAKENIESLKEYGYFNFAHVAGARKKDAFNDPENYWLDYKDETLVLNFILPLKTPIKTPDLRIDIYDPEFFVAFEFVEKDPVKLSGAPQGCAMTLIRPNENKFPSSQRLDKALQESSVNEGMGAFYASKISVKCP
ncbi:MAG: DUF1007 family protein [Xanthobacteraceae bacterium]